MTDVPELTLQDLEPELRRAFRNPSAQNPSPQNLIAYFGTMPREHDVPDLDARIIPVESEIDLRERMPPLDQNPRIAFVVPWRTEIPIDIAGRFRLSKVIPIGADSRIRSMFGATELEDGIIKSKLARHLLGRRDPPRYASTRGRLTLDTFWDLWLATEWGVSIDGGLALDALIAWAATNDRGSTFTERTTEDAAGVRDELLDHLDTRLGPAGPAVWRAWESGAGRAALELGVLLEVLESVEDGGVQMWAKLSLKNALGVDDDRYRAVATALGQATQQALRLYEQRAPDGAIRALLRAADERGADVRDALVASDRLPSSWRRRLDKLGAALARGVGAPTIDAMRSALDALAGVERHRSFKEEQQTQTVRRADMAVRLLGWLVARPDGKLEPGASSYAEAEVLGRWYAEEGGFVDRARRVARGTAEGEFGAGVQAVVAAADAARTELDHRFATALQHWVAAGRPSNEVLPIDQAVKRIAARFLEADESRRLLVLLLDGMAWAQAVEILESLGQRSAPWGPLAWHRNRQHRIGEGAYPVVFANLPTVTEVSRAAFFAGKPMPSGSGTTTDKDRDRWLDNRDIQPFHNPSNPPDVMLRPEGHDRSGVASPQALDRVTNSDRRLVAMVINAIDASLKADTQQHAEWRADNIRSLPALLEAARDAGRAVLLASDHGHVPGDRLASIAALSDRGGARWRPWKEGEPVGDHELLFRGTGVTVPKGADGVVLLTDDESRYGGAPHAGEHGGATLAEVVAPCVLIGCEAFPTTVLQDAQMRLMRAHEPTWWHPAELLVETRTPPPASKRAPSKPPARVVERKPAQLELPVVVAPAQPPPAQPPPAEPSPAMAAFAASELLKVRARKADVRQQVVQAVEFLIDRNGIASATAFAAALQELPFRIGGLVAKLQEVVNVEGYQILRYDPALGQVHLDREKLAQQFEVDL